MTGRLTLVCSGATAAMRRGFLPLDEPMDSRFLAPAARLKLSPAVRVLASPAKRAADTAAALGLAATTADALRDQDNGVWTGKSLEEIAVTGLLPCWTSDPDFAPDGGEPFRAVARRIAAFLEEILPVSGHTLAITHPAVIRAAILHVLDAPLASCARIDVEALGVAELRNDGRRWVVRGLV